MLHDPDNDIDQIMLHSQIFPNYSSAQRSPAKDSALARIREKRAALKVIAANARIDNVGGVANDAR
jgi:hypothetical protein